MESLDVLFSSMIDRTDILNQKTIGPMKEDFLPNQDELRLVRSSRGVVQNSSIKAMKSKGSDCKTLNDYESFEWILTLQAPSPLKTNKLL